MPLPLKYYQRNVCISSLPFIFPDSFCFEEAWNSNRLMATLQLYWLTVSGRDLQRLRTYPETGAGELPHFPAEGRRGGGSDLQQGARKNIYPVFRSPLKSHFGEETLVILVSQHQIGLNPLQILSPKCSYVFLQMWGKEEEQSLETTSLGSTTTSLNVPKFHVLIPLQISYFAFKKWGIFLKSWLLLGWESIFFSLDTNTCPNTSAARCQGWWRAVDHPTLHKGSVRSWRILQLLCKLSVLGSISEWSFNGTSKWSFHLYVRCCNIILQSQVER